MRYSLHVNQFQALRLGITNINEALIFDLLISASTWANVEIVNDSVYYWVARQTIANELELLDLKPDTVYRHLKSLKRINLIEYIKVGKKDCIKMTDLGKKYISKDNNSTMSEINPKIAENSEINPSKFGNKSENSSDLFPTYPTTTLYQYTNNPLSMGKRGMSFKKFREIVAKSKLQFSITGKLGYSKEHQGFQIKNGLIFDMHLQKLTSKDDAFKIWDYLFSKKKEVFKLLRKLEETQHAS